MLKKKQITVHSVVRNEAFIYYSIKSIYLYVDKILLYDTGSNDQNTLKDIALLLKEDVDNKIEFKQFEIDVDETVWNFDNLSKMRRHSLNLKSTVGSIRKLQIQDTDTEFFLIVDGDEIYYKKGISYIKNNIIPKWDDNYIVGYIPLLWFVDINKTHEISFYKRDKANREDVFIGSSCRTTSGRIFKTKDVWLNNVSPGEMHIEKRTNKSLGLKHPKSLVYSCQYYAHFELLLKPWRRKAEGVAFFKGYLPEVMEQNPYYIERLKAIYDNKKTG